MLLLKLFIPPPHQHQVISELRGALEAARDDALSARQSQRAAATAADTARAEASAATARLLQVGDAPKELATARLRAESLSTERDRLTCKMLPLVGIDSTASNPLFFSRPRRAGGWVLYS